MTTEQLTKAQTRLSLAIKAVFDAVPEKRRDDLAGEMVIVDRAARRELSAVYLLSIIWPGCQHRYSSREGIGRAINRLLEEYEAF